MNARNRVEDLTYLVAQPKNTQKCNKCKHEFPNTKVIIASINTWFITYKPTVILCEWCYVNHILRNPDIEVVKKLYIGEDVELDI